MFKVGNSYNIKLDGLLHQLQFVDYCGINNCLLLFSEILPNGNKREYLFTRKELKEVK